MGDLDEKADAPWHHIEEEAAEADSMGLRMWTVDDDAPSAWLGHATDGACIDDE